MGSNNYCSKCGKLNKDNSLFCENCGSKLKLSKVVENQEVNVSDNINVNKINHFKKFKWVLAAALLLGLVGSYIGYRYYLNNRSQYDTQEMAQKYVDNQYGKNQFDVFYDKKSNTFTINFRFNNDIKDSILNNLEYDDNDRNTNKFNDKYRQLLSSISAHMGSKYSKFKTQLSNPVNDNKYILISSNKGITYNLIN